MTDAVAASPSWHRLLSFAGRHGPVMLLVGAMVGLAAPGLATAARPLMPIAVFVFTLGAFLKVDLAAFRATLHDRVWVIAALTWSTIGVPVLMLIVIAIMRPGEELAQGMMLCALAPPVGSAAAIAAMLELDAAFALLATIAATVLSPLILPPLAAALSGTHIEIDPVSMMSRLAVIVGGACMTAMLLRRFAGRFVANNPHAMTGVSVVGLILVAVGAMRGMQAHFLDHPVEVVNFLALAFAVNVGFHLIGAAMFLWGNSTPGGNSTRGGNGTRAMTVGLVSGNRNVTLAWAAAGSMATGHPQLELFLAMSVLPIFVLPAFWRRVLPRVERRLGRIAPAPAA